MGIVKHEWQGACKEYEWNRVRDGLCWLKYVFRLFEVELSDLTCFLGFSATHTQA